MFAIQFNDDGRYAGTERTQLTLLLLLNVDWTFCIWSSAGW